MSPLLTALVALQRLDTAVEAARRRLAEMPAAEQAIVARESAAAAGVEASKAQLGENQRARRELEKQVALVDGRLARFEDHKAAVKTNQEFTALLHEIATARKEKDGLEEQILLLLEDADGIMAGGTAADQTLAESRREGAAARAALAAERQDLEAEITRLATDRARSLAAVDPPTLARYEQLLKARRMTAVAPIDGEMCTACHVRLRPAVAQHIRRNEDIVQCDSCQRILYYAPKAAT
jgi:predicted  nucleic acid-binding Zn-ribbon protein